VPLVGRGHLEHAPRECEWYLRVRPAPKNPGPKDRKQDGYELVVKAPQRALPEAGGEIAVNPKRIGLAGKDADAARLEALVFLARKSGRKRRATNWPIERIQSLLAFDVLEKYVDTFLADKPKGVAEIAVQWSDEAGIDRNVLAAHADTTAHTLGLKYGDPVREAFLQKAAEEMTQGAWRKRGQRKAKVTRLFRQAGPKTDAKTDAKTGPRSTASKSALKSGLSSEASSEVPAPGPYYRRRVGKGRPG
jgi:hypothetical protein